MGTNRKAHSMLPMGEQPLVARVSAGPIVADTFAGRIDVEWDNSATVTPLGQLPFFIEYLKQGPLVRRLCGGLSAVLKEPESPARRDVLGTVLLSILAGHWRYASANSRS
jgi:hypothetical protein